MKLRDVLITITTGSCPGEFVYTLQTADEKTVESRRRTVHSPEEAAATAIKLAILHGKSSYYIFGPREVLEQIPPHLRSKTS